MNSLSENITYWLQMLSIAFLSYEQVILNYFNVINLQIQGYFCWNSEILFLGIQVWVLKYKDCLVLKDAHFS